MSRWHEASVEVLSAMLNSEDFISENIEKLRPDDFPLDSHSLLFTKIQELFFAGKAVSASTTYIECTEAERKILPVSEITSINGTYIGYAHAGVFLNALLDESRKLKLRKMLSEVAKEIPHAESGEIIERLMDTLEKVQSAGDANKFSMKLGEACEEVLNELGKPRRRGVVDAGFKSISYYTNGGFNLGDLIIIGGRPSMGKTAFSLSLIDNMTKKHARALIVEMEMSHEKLARRFLSQSSMVPLRTLYNAQEPKDGDREAVLRSTEKYKQVERIYIDTTPGISLQRLRSVVKRHVQKFHVNVIVVDHIGLMKYPDPRNANSSISQISKGLKEIAREFNVVVIALSQLSREVERRADKRPQLSDLRDSGSIEQDADLVMFLYRDSYYRNASDPDAKVPDLDELEVHIAKGRDSGTASLKFKYRLSNQFIYE